MTILRVLVLLALAAVAAACGQKGPLVLPDAQHPRKKVKLPAAPKPPAATPATPEASVTPEASDSTPNPGPQP
jgi:predicted small lipoprotein YifL